MYAGNPKLIILAGAGHGGRGGRGSSQTLTGEAYGSIFYPSALGCQGGSINATYPGGRGGGVINLNVTGTLHNDGTVHCNGEAGSRGSGGGSGGSILIYAGLIKVSS